MLNTILVVDDNDDDLFYAQIVLKAAGVARQVRLMETAHDTLGLVQSPDGAQVDLILLDINMPEMSGFEFLDHYQPLFETGQCKATVVMHSSSDDPADHQRAHAYGCVKGYLVKPLNKQLAQSLAELGRA
jgi:CheY-like chemotaxis protein